MLTDYTSGGDAATSFNITIDFVGTDWTPELQQAFVDAADYLSTIITGDLADITADFGDGQGVRTIDDIEITAELAAIDGIGGVLGQAGPTAYRTADFLPVTGGMEFDSADAQSLYDNGGWYDVVLHEMIHVLGFGTMWELMGLVEDVDPTEGIDYRFTGAQAMYEYEALYPSQYDADPNAALGVAVESDEGGAGTVGGHWDEATFGSELMTGFLNNDATLSNMSIAALDDMGYETTYSATVVCFVAGTKIKTKRGMKPIEALKEGEEVWTFTRGYQKLRMKTEQRCKAEWLAQNKKAWPIRIQKGALGGNQPATALLVSPQHRLLVSIGGRLRFVKAKHLLAHKGVSYAKGRARKTLTYYNLLFDQHEVIEANGAFCESFYPGAFALLALDIAERAKVVEIARQKSWRDKNGRLRPLAFDEIRTSTLRALNLPKTLNIAIERGALEERFEKDGGRPQLVA